jgi:hypothetical protein
MIVLRKLRTLRSIGWDGARLVIEAMSLTMLVPAGFKLLGVARTQAGLRRWASICRISRQTEDFQVAIFSTRRAQGIAIRTLGIRGTCLSRSFVLWALLFSRGVDAELRVGFRKGQTTLEGHAWLEHRGVALNERPTVIETYVVSGNPTAFDRYKGKEWI